MSLAKVKIAVGAVIIAGLGTTLVLEQQALTKLRRENQALQARLNGLASMAREHERLSNLLAQSASRSTLPGDQFRELLRLRGEVGLARHVKDAIPKVRSENARLRSASQVVNAPAPKEPENPAEAEFQRETQHRKDNLSQWGLIFLIAARKNNDQCPYTWAQVADQIGPEHRDSFLQFATNHFEIVYRGKLGEDGSGETILFREKEARRSPAGGWLKVYGFADGHTEIHTEPDGHFEAWERPRLAGAR